MFYNSFIYTIKTFYLCVLTKLALWILLKNWLSMSGNRLGYYLYSLLCVVFNMEYILLIIFLIFFGYLYYYFYNRKIKYIEFYYQIDELCLEFNLWQLRKGIRYWDSNFENAFDFCRAKYDLPINMPLSLMFSKVVNHI